MILRTLTFILSINIVKYKVQTLSFCVWKTRTCCKHPLSKEEKGEWDFPRANFFVEPHASWHRGHSNVTWPVISRRICSSSIAGWRHFSASWERMEQVVVSTRVPISCQAGINICQHNNHLNSSMSHWSISDSGPFYGPHVLALKLHGWTSLRPD